MQVRYYIVSPHGLVNLFNIQGRVSIKLASLVSYQSGRLYPTQYEYITPTYCLYQKLSLVLYVNSIQCLQICKHTKGLGLIPRFTWSKHPRKTGFLRSFVIVETDLARLTNGINCMVLYENIYLSLMTTVFSVSPLMHFSLIYDVIFSNLVCYFSRIQKLQ